MLSQKPLQNQCIWITRPAHQATDLQSKIHDAGGQSIHVPTMIIDRLLLTIEPPNNGKTVYAIFTSGNAVPSAAKALKHAHINTVNLAIGPGTAAALQNHGLDVHACAPAPFGTQALLTMPLWASLQPAHHHVWVFTGQDCSQTLIQALSERCFQPHTHACYRRRCPDASIADLLTPVLRQRITAITSTSADLLTNLWRMTPLALQPWLRQTPLLVINQAMVQLAKELGFTSIHQADNASTAAVMSGLLWMLLRHPVNPGGL